MYSGVSKAHARSCRPHAPQYQRSLGRIAKPVYVNCGEVQINKAYAVSACPYTSIGVFHLRACG
jgi:hypothetical protein